MANFAKWLWAEPPGFKRCTCIGIEMKSNHIMNVSLWLTVDQLLGRKCKSYYRFCNGFGWSDRPICKQKSCVSRNTNREWIWSTPTSHRNLYIYQKYSFNAQQKFLECKSYVFVFLAMTWLLQIQLLAINLLSNKFNATKITNKLSMKNEKEDNRLKNFNNSLKRGIAITQNSVPHISS